MEIHGQVRVFPFACHAQAFEFFALNINPAFGEFAAFGTEIDNVNFVFVFAFGAVLFFDFPFDRQTVAIPTWDIPRITAQHLLAAHDEVFQDLVQCVTDMQMPVRIGGAIMQHKWRTPRFFAQAVIDTHFFPSCQPIRFTLWQTCAHWKFGFRQV